MHFSRLSLLALLQASFGLAAVIEKLNAPPAGWYRDADISAEIDKDALMMKLRIHLVHQDMDKFHDLATQVCSIFSSKSL